jgi:hypothetical protein
VVNGKNPQPSAFMHASKMFFMTVPNPRSERSSHCPLVRMNSSCVEPGLTQVIFSGGGGGGATAIGVACSVTHPPSTMAAHQGGSRI